MGKEWFVVQSHFGCEFKIERFLKIKVKNAGMDKFFGRIFVPTEDVVENKDGKKFIFKKKLFPGYVLIEMEMCEKSLDLVRYLPNVFGFVGNFYGPCPLEKKEIDFIFSRIAETEKKPRPKIVFPVGCSVRIINGPFSDFTGTVEGVNYDKGRLRVAVLIFGRSTPVELEFYQVKKN